MEFKNYERELKYLIKKNDKCSSKQVLKFLYQHGYKLVESFTKEKHETYYDDSELTILNRGDVMRGSNMVTEQFNGFLYKKNMCDPDKPYVSKLELGTKLRGQYKDVNDFVKELDVKIEKELKPILYANMIREVSIIEKNSDRLYISYDKVKYFEKDESESIYEEMLEIEDWKNPNTTDVDYDYDAHLLEVNQLIINSDLPIKLTKDSKYYRGYILLNER